MSQVYNNLPPEKGRQALLQQWTKDFQLWFYITITLVLFRVLLVGIFHKQIGEDTDFIAILQVFFTGLRFDISTAGMWALPTFLLSFAVTLFPLSSFIHRLRRFSASLYALLSIPVFAADIVFFATYGDQYNQMIFGIVHDDTIAILITIWKEFHPLLFTAISAPLMYANYRLLKRWLHYTPMHLHKVSLQKKAVGITLATVMFFLMAAMVRGGTLSGEPILLKHAFVTNDLMLNRCVVNPFAALHHTLDDKVKLENGIALERFWPNEDINGALRYEQTQRDTSPTNSKNLDQQLEKHAKGYKGKKPKHIFLLLMESQSGWTVMPAYRFAGLSPELSNLADKGIYFPTFLPSGGGTIDSMNTLITGVPDAGLNINYETTATKAYPSAVATIMKRLGYTTRFFYGGFLSWQRLDTFAQNQGFDEVYGGGKMGVGIHTNEWGVDDQYLYDFVLKTVQSDRPSFNFILTTSNHPPYDLDLDALGYPLRNEVELPAPLESTKNDTVKVLGHLWYADQQAGRFVHQAEKQLPDTLFAITGDHTARLQIEFPGEGVEEQKAVPFILYGPRVLPKSGVTKSTAGSHLDIPTTLIELAANKGFRYTSFGQNMLNKKPPSYGYGKEFIIGEDFLLYQFRPELKSAFEGKVVDDTDTSYCSYSWKFFTGGSLLVCKDDMADEDIEQEIEDTTPSYCTYNWKFFIGENLLVCENEVAEQEILSADAAYCSYSWKFFIGDDLLACRDNGEGKYKNNFKDKYKDKEFTAYALAAKERPAERPQINDEQIRFNALKALGWYRVKEGSKLP